jgi:hypothetical protein
VKIFGGELRAEVSAMASDRTVLHEAPAQEHLLSGNDALASEESRAVRADDLPGDRRRIAVGAIGEDNRVPRTHRPSIAKEHAATMETVAIPFAVISTSFDGTRPTTVL